MSGQQNGSYVERAIDVTITLGTGAFGQSGFNTVKLTGLRTVASILKAASPSMDQADVRIYGATPDVMNQVSTLGVAWATTRAQNTVSISAGDKVNGMALIYQGWLKNAWINYDGAPETFLNISGGGANVMAMQPVPPTSVRGTADVASLIQGLAIQGGWGFENNGVVTKIANPYLAGTAYDQILSIGRAANIEVYFDTGTPGPGNQKPTPGTGTVAIWPKTGTRTGQVPLISADTGLVGYPHYNDAGMGFRCIFNRNIRLGGKINMQSKVGGTAPPPTPTNVTAPVMTPAQAQQAGPNGEWLVQGPLSHDLAAQVPGGPWFTNVNCSRVLVP